MQKEYEELFELMDNVSAGLEKLTQLAQQKNIAALNDDIEKLNEVIHHEQAESMAFRGYENKRVQLLKQLELNHTALSKLAEQCPEEYKEKAKQCTKTLQHNFEVYRGCADIARKRMENNIKEINQTLFGLEKEEKAEGPGYKEQAAEMPEKMKTDFHA